MHNINGVILLVALMVAAACGRDEDDKKDGKAQAPVVTGAVPAGVEPAPAQQPVPDPAPAPTPSPGPTEPAPPPAQLEGDFAGMITVDANGACAITNGNDTDRVTCHFGADYLTGAPQVDLVYSALAMARAPICTFQSLGRYSGPAVLTTITQTQATLVFGQTGSQQSYAPQGGCCGGGAQQPRGGTIALFYCKITG